MARRRKPHRGVLLLVVLSLLVLFVLAAVTFIVVASNYKGATAVTARHQRTGDPPQKLLDGVMYQLLRGTLSTQSVLMGHSLLEDLYGRDGFVGMMVGAPIYLQDVNEQLIELTVGIERHLSFEGPISRDQNGDPQLDGFGNPIPVMRRAGYFNGCLLSFVSGELSGESTRIVRFVPTAPDNIFARIVIVAPQSPGQIRISDRFVVNGQPFNGTGAGFNRGTQKLDLTPFVTPFQVALTPNYGTYGRPDVVRGMGIRVDDPSDDINLLVDVPMTVQDGGLDEGWDAVDFQNMFLSMHAFAVGQPPRIIPSFHRPALVNFWAVQFDGVLDPADQPQMGLLRSILFRPNWVDHPNFTGSNPALDPLTTSDPGEPAVAHTELIGRLIVGYWDSNADGVVETTADVDNNGDGINDSYWLDAGFPIARATDGRTYKALFSILCEDLDGRVNVNAAGNVAQFPEVPGFSDMYSNPLYYNPLDQSAIVMDPATLSTLVPGDLSALLTLAPMPHGSGVGPAEIQLKPITGVESAALVSARYLSDVEPSGFPGYQLDDMLPFPWKAAGIPLDHTLLPALYSTPPDLHGRGITVLDHAGQPMMLNMGLPEAVLQAEGLPPESVDDPYEFNLVDESASDARYSEYDLERLLRFFDRDAESLSPRLLAQGVNAFMVANDAALRRRWVTTRSFEVPALPAFVPDPVEYPPADFPNGLVTSQGQQVRTIVDLFDARLFVESIAANGPPADIQLEIARIQLEIAKMVPHEILRGQKFDLNRLLGDTLDNNTNGITDEPGEVSVSVLNDDPYFIAPSPLGPGQDPVAIQEWYRVRVSPARQQFARHLYCLMMFLKPPKYQIDIDGDAVKTDEETARAIAQWAINVVDFRDPDVIMSPFEYDPDPYDGWNVNGDLIDNTGDATNRGVVWGCERPELLITETMAWHDRRTEDLDDEADSNIDVNGDGAMDGDDAATVAEGDDDFDQRLRPRAAFFVELYNPGLQGNSPSYELYSNGGPPSEGIVLDKVNLNSAGSTVSAVWRLLVLRGVLDYSDPDDPATVIDPSQVERTVYFTRLGSVPIKPPTVFGIEYGTSFQQSIPPILPGRYAVVGSGQPGSNESVSTVGRLRSDDDTVVGGIRYLNTRRVVLRPSPNPNLPQVEVFNPAPSAFAPPDIQPAIAVPIDEPRSLNISDPLHVAGYDAPEFPMTFDPTAAAGEGAYTTVRDLPLDYERATKDAVSTLRWSALKETGTTRNFRTVYLQRLANPEAAYDPDLNPYRTIDWMSVDLTAFSGATDEEDPDAPEKSTDFTTFQRGRAEFEVTVGVAPAPPRGLWPHEPAFLLDPTTDSPEVADEHFFPFVLQHSLGYMNSPYGLALNGTTAPAPAYAGQPNAESIVDAHTFPWLTWQNRPFNSPIELLLVPRSSPSRLLLDYSYRGAYKVLLPGNPATVDPAVDEYDTAAAQRPGSSFGHLLNLFSYDATDSPHFYRILDYVEVRSPFAGTEQWLNESDFGVTALGVGAPNATGMRPPFNYISHFRNPGKININTVFNASVWNSLVAGFPNWLTAAGPKWDQVAQSRQGYSDPLYAMSDGYPTLFTNPFRSAANAGFMPDVISNSISMRKTGIEATLLRPIVPADSEPMLINDSLEPYNSTDRNPYFRYQGMQRLANLVTTQSNCYAVWITVGFFEYGPVVDPLTGQVRQALGQELGSDTGDIKRHRAFYVIDRSIPVAFEPGQNHNVDKCVVLRRFIE